MYREIVRFWGNKIENVSCNSMFLVKGVWIINREKYISGSKNWRKICINLNVIYLTFLVNNLFEVFYLKINIFLRW